MIDCLIDQNGGMDTGIFQSHERNEGGLSCRGVLAGCLAHFLRRSFFIQYVICDLKGQP